VHRNRSSGGVCVDTAEATPVRFPERARSRGPPRSGPVKIRVRVEEGPIAGLATEGHLSNVFFPACMTLLTSPRTPSPMNSHGTAVAAP
jgi:hypothetical protein